MPGILKKTSFGLLRTNPKLTTNIKIVADSNDLIYLETIDANPDLTRSIFKGYKISPNGSYSYDLRRFYTQTGNPLPESIAYWVYEEDDSTVVKDRYKDQYDFTYGYGMSTKNSKIYSEEFSMFAPLWLEKDSVPDYFLIFKMDGPVMVNSKEYREGSTSIVNLDTDTIIKSYTEDPEYFFSNIIQKSRIIKSFDLTESSSIGRYIRNHINDANFPESPVYISMDRYEDSYWNGISYLNGGFTKKAEEIHNVFVLSDKTIIENEDYITDGFRREGVVCANLLNLEFLFDDTEQEEYKFSRYYGLYVSEVELGKFSLSADRLFNDKDNEVSQLPSPKLNQRIGDPLSEISSIQTNPKGIKIYPEIGPSGPYSGRLMNWNELQNSRFGYVKDINENFYSIDNITNWSSLVSIAATGSTPSSFTYDTNYLRVKNKTIDWKNFTGFEAPFSFIPAESTSNLGRAGIAFKVISRPNGGDEIRIQYTDPNNPNESSFVDVHTVDSFTTLEPGVNNGITFSNKGTLKQITNAIANAINQIPIYANDDKAFKAIVIEDEIVIFSKILSEVWNKIKVSFFSSSGNFPFEISNQYVDPITVSNYIPSPISSSPMTPGKLLVVNFTGGNSNGSSRAIVERQYVQEFRDSKDNIYVKTNKGYQVTGNYSLYLDEPIKSDSGQIIGFKNYSKYYVINLSNEKENFEFGSSKKIALYKKAKNSNGYISIFPIKDFDFDFYNQDYKKGADSIPYGYPLGMTGLYEWYKGGTNGTGDVPLFNWPFLGATGKTSINELIGEDSQFVQDGGFQSIIGYQDDFNDVNEEIFNEYDRLKENTLDELALPSRVVPYINKWVYDNESKDIRENGYRLNTDQAFGYSNFSPDFSQIEKSPKFFTHEWYYLQKYPPYMTLDQRINSYSYFDEDLYFPTLPIVGSLGSTAYYQDLVGSTGATANLLSTQEDYFLRYFTRETVTIGPTSYPIPREFKYSIFANGTDSIPSDTLFRGVKVEILDRSENSNITYNKNNLKYIYNEKYIGYKFSCVLTYGNAGTQIYCIKNDKWRTVTLVISADLENLFLSYKNNITNEVHRFIDRSHLYTLLNKQVLNTAKDGFDFVDKTVSGRISNWNDETTHFLVELTTDVTGNLPILDSEINTNINGSFNDLKIKDPTNTYEYTFKGISNVTSTSFRCAAILDLPSCPSPLLPSNGVNGLQNIINNAWQFTAGVFTSPLFTNPLYIQGGYQGYRSIIDNLSFSSIQDSINSGDPEIRYISVDSAGNVTENNFVLNIIKPNEVVKSTYLKREVLEKTSNEIQLPARILGYQLASLPRLELSPIIRYQGQYTPKWRDIIKFVDTDDIKNEGLDYNNIQILDKLPHLKDNDLGLIKNLFYNKVNTENPRGVLYRFLNQYEESFILPIYPLLGEIAIDKRDFFIFKSNWDASYYNRNLSSLTSENVIGTREPKEEKSFFGSKVISIPNEVRIETFPLGISEEDEFIEFGSSINNISSSIVITPINRRIRRNITTKYKINVYVTKSLEQWLLDDGFGNEFNKYIDPSYSFGDVGIEDDTRLYIRENIFDRYSVKEVIMWEKTWVPSKTVTSIPFIVTDLTDSQKSLNGYVRSKNFQYKTNQLSSLDFEVIYTIPTDKRTSIAFTVVLEKK